MFLSRKALQPFPHDGRIPETVAKNPAIQPLLISPGPWNRRHGDFMLPSGTVTFLFTDIVGSTARWESDAQKMERALREHDIILNRIATENSGVVFKTVGDAFCMAFEEADRAVATATMAQSALSLADDPLPVRMAIHTASIHPTGSDYFGPPLNRVARILSAANGGQILISDCARSELSPELELKDLGLHTLKDLLEPTRIWQFGTDDFGQIKSLSGIPNNLPAQTTSFVGREEELNTIRNLFGKSRLVTLVGPGGTGKSRLSLQIAAEQMDQFPDGVWFCELAPLSPGEDIVRAIQSSFGISDGAASVERLEAFLRRKQCLVILDNCEHVLGQASSVAEFLMSRCPGVTILTTSREPLGARGETTIRVPTLSIPDIVNGVKLEDLDHYGSTALFLDRFSAAAPNYAIEASEAKTITQICKRLDGIPLAIELAAARGRAMNLQMIEKRLDDRFKLLTGGSRNALTRQQTLRALIDWSVNLLDEAERAFFISLAVFSGNWNATAVERTCGMDEWEVIDLLTALVDKSLVVFDHQHERYHMLESIRQFAVDELESDENSHALHARHAEHFLELCMLFDDNGYATTPSAHHQIQTNFENFRAAIQWTSHQSDGLERAISSLCRSQYAFYSMGRPDEFARILEPMLERAENAISPDALAHAHFCLTRAYNGMGDIRGVAICHVMRDKFESLSAKLRELWRGQIGYSLFCEQQFEDCIDFFAKGQPPEDLDARHWFYIGQSHACLGRYDEAIAAMLEARSRGMGPEDTGGYVINLSGVLMTYLLAGNLTKALPIALDLNRVATSNKVFPFFRGLVLATFGLHALNMGQPSFACACAGGMSTLQELSNRTSDPIDRLAIEAFLRRVSELPRSVREPAFAAGSRLDWEPWFVSLMELDAADASVPFPDLLKGVPEDRVFEKAAA